MFLSLIRGFIQRFCVYCAKNKASQPPNSRRLEYSFKLSEFDVRLTELDWKTVPQFSTRNSKRPVTEA